MNWLLVRLNNDLANTQIALSAILNPAGLDNPIQVESSGGQTLIWDRLRRICSLCHQMTTYRLKKFI
jgi:hypothetical protein